MDKHIIFVCTEQRQKYFREELCKSINKLKEEAIIKSSDVNCISLCSISVSGKTTSSSGSPTLTDSVSNSGNLVVLKHNFADENPLEQLLPIQDIPSASEPNTEEDFRSADFLAVAEQLHSLADGFGVPGSYLVYVIWCVEAYVPDPSEVCEVYAALHRLQSWHRACLVMASPDSACVQGWSAALPLHLTADTTHVVMGALQCMWRGDLCSGEGGTVREKGGGGERLTDLVINCTAVQSVLSAQKKKHGGSIFLLDECSVVSSVQLSSVPCLLAHPGGLYQLCSALDTTPEQAEHTAATLEQLTDSDQVGALLRLHYSHTPPALGAGGPRALTTVEWRRQLSEGAFDTAPTLTLQGPQHSLHLLAVTCRRGTVLAVGLRSPDSLGEDVWRLVSNTPSGVLSFSNAQDVEQKIDTLLQETTYFSKQQMDVLAHLQMHLPARITKKLLNKGNNLSTLWEQTKDDLEALASQEVLALLHSRGDGATFRQLQRDQRLTTTEVVPEHHEWPEYQALVAAELREQRAHSQRATEGQLLGGIAPPRSPDTIITLDAAHLSKTFRQDPLFQLAFYNKLDLKKPSTVTNVENNNCINGGKERKKLYSIMDHYPFKTNASASEAMSAEFPESLYINYHDIYYNRDERRETFEEDCNKFRQRHIRRELASVCSSFHDGTQLFVTVPTSDSSTTAVTARADGDAAGLKERIQQAGRTVTADCDTVSIRSTASSRKIALRKSPRKRSSFTGSEASERAPLKKGMDSTGVSRPSDLLAPRGTSSPAIHSSDLMAPKKSSIKPSDLLAPKRASMGPRVAPPPGRVRRHQTIVSAELSDAHKQKLRGAVLTALEDEGVTMKNALFKMCFKKLFAVCRPFATDVIGRGSTSRNMEKIARAHVKQVIDFERRLDKR